MEKKIIIPSEFKKIEIVSLLTEARYISENFEISNENKFGEFDIAARIESIIKTIEKYSKIKEYEKE